MRLTAYCVSSLIGNNALVALTLMIAESRTEEKDVMVKVVINLINRNKLTLTRRIKVDLMLSCFWFSIKPRHGDVDGMIIGIDVIQLLFLLQALDVAGGGCFGESAKTLEVGPG